MVAVACSLLGRQWKKYKKYFKVFKQQLKRKNVYISNVPAAKFTCLLAATCGTCIKLNQNKTKGQKLWKNNRKKGNMC
jgi:hypothetical protein